MQRKILLFVVALLAFSIPVSQTGSLYASIVERYMSTIKRLEPAYKHLVDDVTGMMEIAKRFRDPDYDYSPDDVRQIVMSDGVNGTQELLETFNDLINLTENISHAITHEG